MRKPYKRKNKTELRCLNCNTEFWGQFPHRKYCSIECGRMAQRKRKIDGGFTTSIFGISSATSGAIGELRVSSELLSFGFNVFRALSPACPCDLVVLYDGIPFRVEVRTGTINSDGSYGYSFKEKDANKQDVVAVVLPKSIYFESKTDIGSLLCKEIEEKRSSLP